MAKYQCPKCKRSDLAILCKTERTCFIDEDGEVTGGSEPGDGYRWGDNNEAHCASQGCQWVGTVRDLRVKQTCTPYDGRFTKEQQENLLDFLWSSLRPVPGVDQVHTGYDTKTKTGLLRVIESIVFPPTKKKGKSS